MYGLLTLFLVKALLVAFFVTPLWDVPDETGHFAYIDELRHGSLPVLGRSVIPVEIVRDWKGAGPAEPNWISQHPPFYHLAAVPFVFVAESVTTNREIIYRSPRILSALLGAATLWALFAALSLTGTEGRRRDAREPAGGTPALQGRPFAAACATMLAFTPMFTHLSAGTNHDVAVALLACLAARELLLLHREFSWRVAYRLAFFLAAGGTVKLSTLPVTIAILIIVFAWSWPHRKLLHSAALAAIALLPPTLWVIRNYVYTGSSQLLAQPSEPKLNVLQFFTQHPVIEHTVKNFLGLIGWMGGGNELRWLQIGGAAYVPFFLLIAVVAIAATFHYAGVMHKSNRRMATATATIWLATLTVMAIHLPHPSLGVFAESSIYALLVASGAFAFLLLDRGQRHEIELAALFIVIVFTAGYGLRIWNAFLATGTMRATHGRYFYAALPFLALAWLYPAFRVADERGVGRAALIGGCLLAIVGEGYFYLHDVLPFFG
jgi:hypothetical protein